MHDRAGDDVIVFEHDQEMLGELFVHFVDQYGQRALGGHACFGVVQQGLRVLAELCGLFPFGAADGFDEIGEKNRRVRIGGFELVPGPRSGVSREKVCKQGCLSVSGRRGEEDQSSVALIIQPLN